MGAKSGIGISGMVLAAAIAFVMCVVSYIFKPVDIIPVEYGVCLHSPDEWQINGFVSWLINTALIALIALVLHMVNRSFNFIRTTEPALPAIFLIMAASSPWFTQGLNTSTLLCLVNVVALPVIFSTYNSGNATREMFILGLALGIGSMFQYGFLPMACVYILWALFMKVLTFKVVLAFLVGILCPYWISLGFGWVHFKDFHFPSLVTLLGTSHDHSDILFLLTGIGVATLIGFFTGVTNSLKLYAGNSRVNAMNLCVSTLGLAAFICILVDYENIPAYVMTLYMATAVQLANLCALWNIKKEWTVTLIPSVLFIALFIGNMLL